MNKTAPVPGWVAITTTYDVLIPSADGLSVVGHKTIEVPAWKAPDGEIYLDDEANDKIDQTKARLMGILSPAEIKNLRIRLHLTQKEISELLQIGEKSWTRWETGREHLSGAINVLLCALNDGKIDITYLSGDRSSDKNIGRHWTAPSISKNASKPTLYDTRRSQIAPLKYNDDDSNALAA